MNRLMLTALMAALTYTAPIAAHPDLDGGRDYRKVREARERRDREADARRKERQEASAKNADWQLQRAAEKRARKAQKLRQAFTPNAELTGKPANE